jgi:putative ABC transport system permease protein
MPDWAQHLREKLSTVRLSPAREAEIVEELSQHLDDRWRELIAGGASEEEATRLAVAEFREGNVLARRLAALRQANQAPPIVPGAATGSVLGDLWQDLRYAARTLPKQRGFAVAAILILALGIGANAAIFSVINAILLRPLPFANSNRLVALYTRYLPPSGYDFPYFGMSGPEFADVRSRVQAFERIAAYGFATRNLTGTDGQAERVLTMRVTAQFFDVLGVQPTQGRVFTEDEAQRQNGCVALLAHDPLERAGSAIGTTIRLDDAPCEVIGVMPEGFGFRESIPVKVWTTLRIDQEETTINRQSHGLTAIARIREGVSSEQADAQLQSLRAYWSENLS